MELYLHLSFLGFLSRKRRIDFRRSGLMHNGVSYMTSHGIVHNYSTLKSISISQARSGTIYAKVELKSALISVCIYY